MKERVQKLMAQAGIASRRESETLIQQGRVKVNGRVIHLGDQADPTQDIIEVDGEKLSFPQRHTYIAVYKPRYVLSTHEAHKGDERQTVYDLVPFEGRLFSIGRLDVDSEGLMVLTDDGDLANRLAHPRYKHSKTYKVVVQGIPTAETIQKWERGVYLVDDETGEGFQTAPCKVEITQGGKESTLRIVMGEGKKRQIRRVANLLGHPVKSLVRTHIGRLGLGALRPGEWRELTADDVQALKARALEMTAKPLPAPRVRPAAGKPPAPRTTRRKKDDDRPPRNRREDDEDRPPRRPARPGRPGGGESSDEQPQRPPNRKPKGAPRDNDDKPRRPPRKPTAPRRDDDRGRGRPPAGRKQQRRPSGGNRRGRG